MTSGADSTQPLPPGPIGVVVAVADDGERATLGRLLREDGRFEVLAEVGDAASTVAAVAEVLPDVAFVDVAMTDAAGPTTADQQAGQSPISTIRREIPSVAVVAVAHEDGDLAQRGFAAGAMACHLWSAPSAPALPAGEMAARVVRGEGLPTPRWAGEMLGQITSSKESPGQVPPPTLTPSEQEVLQRIAAGAVPGDVAHIHGVTVHMVNVQAGAAMTKLWRHHDDCEQVARLHPE